MQTYPKQYVLRTLNMLLFWSIGCLVGTPAGSAQDKDAGSSKSQESGANKSQEQRQSETNGRDAESEEGTEDGGKQADKDNHRIIHREKTLTNECFLTADDAYDPFNARSRGKSAISAMASEKSRSLPTTDRLCRLSRCHIKATIKASRASLVECAKKEKQSGTIYLRFSIRENGSTERVKVISEEFSETPLASCVTNMVRAMEFPPAQTKITLTYPFMLDPDQEVPESPRPEATEQCPEPKCAP